MTRQPHQKNTIIATGDAALAQAEALLRAGDPVAIPTETVYGLAADATNAAAVAHIYAAKGRPSFNPLIAHVSGAAMAAEHVEVAPLAARLMAAFWPGPLTLVLPKLESSTVAGLVTAGLSTLAVRCPDHPVPQMLIMALEKPLAAPSANISGGISSTRAQHVKESLGGRIKLIIDGGPCRAGVESTIVAVENDHLRLLRPGGVTYDMLATFAPVETASGGSIEAPGMMTSHYAPAKPLRLNAIDRRAGEFLIGFGTIEGDASLSTDGDLVEAASRLFDLLHIADASKSTAIAVAPIPQSDLGVAINDRLQRAASPK